MELFTNSGHLTEEALLALIQGQDFDDLARLEIAEHLAYCDHCLQRYTELLTEQTLMIPTVSCQFPLRQRIRQRTLRILTSRYSAAAAAIVLALTILWGDLPSTIADQFPLPEDKLPITEQWNNSLDDVFSRLYEVFDQIDAFTRLH